MRNIKGSSSGRKILNLHERVKHTENGKYVGT